MLMVLPGKIGWISLIQVVFDQSTFRYILSVFTMYDFGQKQALPVQGWFIMVFPAGWYSEILIMRFLSF